MIFRLNLTPEIKQTFKCSDTFSSEIRVILGYARLYSCADKLLKLIIDSFIITLISKLLDFIEDTLHVFFLVDSYTEH